MPRPNATVYGHIIAPCRVTRGGVYIALTRLALPFLLVMVLLDVLFWAVARSMGACYGVLCLL